MKKIILTIVLLFSLLLVVACSNEGKATVTFMVDDSIYYQEVVSKGNTITFPDEPLKEDARFEYWMEKDQIYDVNKIITTNITLNAHFNKLDADQIMIIFYDGTKLLSTMPIKINSIVKVFPDTNKDGYTFDGWYLDSECTNKYQSQELKQSTKMYGKWLEGNQAAIKIVSFYDGVSLIGVEQVTAGNPLLSFPNTTKVGHKFEGWYLDIELTQKFVNGVITTNINLYGKWSVDSASSELQAYYKGFNLEGKTGDELLENLKTRLYKGTRIQKYGANLHPTLIKADAHPTKPGYVYTIYDGAAMRNDANGSGGDNAWNKEHVIPQSWFKPKYNGHIGDVHNLRISRASINSSRSNDKFALGTGSYKANTNGGFYPGDDHKGDCARITMYMLVMMSDLLKINNMVAKDNGATLLKWHLEDPVDDFERNRNNELFKFQGNRNPFIDHPEFAAAIWKTLSKQPSFSNDISICLLNNVVATLSDIKTKRYIS